MRCRSSGRTVVVGDRQEGGGIRFAGQLILHVVVYALREGTPAWVLLGGNAS